MIDAVSFAQELEMTCRDAGIIGSEFAAVSEAINGRISWDTVSDYYIVAGPLPAFPNLKLDVFLLTEHFVYNYAVTTLTGDEWTIFPLTGISRFKENRTPDTRFWYLTLSEQSQNGSGLVLLDRIENRDKIRSFTNNCLDNMAALIKLSK